MGKNPEQRRLAAIMFTDMVGYSALSQRDEVLAIELLEEHRALLRPFFPRFNGTEIKTIGDAFMVEFQGALAAVQCAVEIQRLLAKRNADASAERRIELKIGVHIGDVVHRGGDVYGDGVNIAARIEPLAGAGGICVSMDVERQVRNMLELRFEKLPPTALKNISVAMDLFRVVLPWEQKTAIRTGSRNFFTSVAARWAGATAILLLVAAVSGWILRRADVGTKQGVTTPGATPGPSVTNTPPAVADQRSIAVLPFVNMSADKDNEYFTDGITEEILNALARTPGLRVAARTSAFSFKGKNESVQHIGETLKVGAVLEGSVRRAGNQLRITAQLISVADGFHLWSDTYDRKSEDVFAIQTEVAQRVQEVLRVKLMVGVGPNTTLAGTENLEAYDLYLRGRELWNKRTAADIQRAVGLFQQATEKDPKFAAAYAGLSSSYALLPSYFAAPVREANPKARAAARRAIELDGSLAEAHAVIGYCAKNEWNLEEAEQEFQSALRLNPNHGNSHHWYALLLRDQGRMEQSLAEFGKAKALDPLSPAIQANIGYTLYFVGRYNEALVEVDRASTLSPKFLPAHNFRGYIFLIQKRITEAIAEFETVREMTGDTPYALGPLGLAYARAGRTAEARQIVERLKSISANGGSGSFQVAMVSMGLGDLDQAFPWLERAAENRDVDPRWLKFDPLFSDVAKDPRYRALLKKFGLDK